MKIKLPNSGKRFDHQKDGWIKSFLTWEFGLSPDFGFAWKPKGQKQVPLITKYKWNSRYIGSTKQKKYSNRIPDKFFKLIELNKIDAFGTSDVCADKFPVNIDIDINDIDCPIIRNKLCSDIKKLLKIDNAYTCISTNGRGTHNHVAIIIPEYKNLSLRDLQDKITNSMLDFKIKTNNLIKENIPQYAENINVDIIGLPVRNYKPNDPKVQNHYKWKDTTPVIEKAGTLIKIPNELFFNESARKSFENRQVIKLEEFDNWFSNIETPVVKKESKAKKLHNDDILTAGSIDTVAKWDVFESTKARFVKFFNSDKLPIQNRRSLSAEEAAEYCIVIEQSCRMNCKSGYYQNTQPINKIKAIWKMNQENGYIENNFNEKKLKVVLQILSGYGIINWEDENWIAPTIDEETGEVKTGRGRKFTFNQESFNSFINITAEASISDTSIEAIGEYSFFEFPFHENFEKMMSGRPINMDFLTPNFDPDGLLTELCVWS